MNRIKTKHFVLILSVTTVIGFQNCTSGFETSRPPLHTDQSSQTTSTDPLQLGDSPLAQITIASCGSLDLVNMRAETGNAYLYEHFAVDGDSTLTPQKSKVVIFENDQELKSAHSIHQTIRDQGAGRFSHWGHGLYFSSSDNSDPRLNGRKYTWGVMGGSCPVKICGAVDVSLAKHETGFNYILSKNFGFVGDSNSQPTQSSLHLYENNVELPFAHSIHRGIRDKGQGRFSHWGNSLYFSSSDNSNPTTNGKSYTYGGNCRELKQLQMTSLATQAPGFATFQSHNQKVLSNKYGIFVSHLVQTLPPDNASDEKYVWKLEWSVDQGKTFALVHQWQSNSKAPAIETDENGNIYLFVSDYPSSNAFLYKYLPSEGFRTAHVTTIPGGAAGKFAAVYDSVRKRLYYSAWGTQFYALDLNGNILLNTYMMSAGPHAGPQYPHLAMKGSTLYLAWTSSVLNKYLYWDIHYMKSEDGGVNWQKTDGTPITLPVVADDTSVAQQLVPSYEFGFHNWLSNFLPKGNALHFMYLSQTIPSHEHYVRINLNTNLTDVRTESEWRGGIFSISSVDGYFTSKDSSQESVLYAVSSSRALPQETGQRVIVLASDDNGQTWFDYAYGPIVNSYSITGSRQLSLDGQIHGMFTQLQKSWIGDIHQVWYFHVQAE